MLSSFRSPSPTATASPATLAQLSRNASVISSSSSSSSSSSLAQEPPTTPTASRYRRAFSPSRIRKRSNPDESIAAATPAVPLAAVAADVALKPKLPLTVPARAIGQTDSGPPTPRTSGTSTPKPLATRADFEFGDPLGEGSFSEVVRVTHKATGKLYAIKCVSKLHLVRRDKVKYAASERDSLALITQGGHHGVVHLFWTFHDASTLYFVISFASNGDLQSLLRSRGSLSLACSRYYTAQLVDTVTWIHSRGILHRDIKPENILLDDQWRMKLTDFGSAKLMRRGQDGAFVEDTENTRSFVGSPQFVSPELLLNEYKYACKSSDLYACGCILFQLLTGDFLFSGQTEFLTFQKIKQGDHTPFPNWLDARAADLVRALLPLNPAERLGAMPKSSPDALKAHAFFSDDRPEDALQPIDWPGLWTEPAPQIETGAGKKGSPLELADHDWDDFEAAESAVQESAVSLSDDEDEVDEAADGIARLEVVPTTSTASPSTRRGSAASSNASASTILAALGIGSGFASRRGSTSHSSDGTGSTRSGEVPQPPIIAPEQMQPFLLPHETVVHATPGHLRRDVLRGLVKTDRPVALCLTSRGRLLAMQASSRRGWRTERVLALSGLNDDDSASETETTASDKQKPTRPTPKVTAERGERVVKLEAGTGSDSRCFTLRTIGQNNVFVASDAPAAARWVELLREAMNEGMVSART